MTASTSRPLDTDRCRELADNRNEVADTWPEYATMADKFREDAATLRAAADEADRLRAVIENAPHAETCKWNWPCTCWKADAL